MKRRFTFALIAMGLAALLVSVGPALAKRGHITGKFTATRCVDFYMAENVPTQVEFAGTQITRLLTSGQYSEWTVVSENELVAGLFIDSDTEGNLKFEPPYGPGAYKGRFLLIPTSASGLWEGNWILVFKSDGNKVFTGEGVGRGGQLEGLIIKIYYEAGPGGTPRCIDNASESFNGEILRNNKR